MIRDKTTYRADGAELPRGGAGLADGGFLNGGLLLADFGKGGLL